jgi:hypothetical protein
MFLGIFFASGCHCAYGKVVSGTVPGAVATGRSARAPEDKALFRRIERLAKQRKAGFFPVWLTCDVEMLRQRKNTPERRARLKDIDLTTITWYLQEFEVFKAQHPNALTLDTSRCGPEITAKRILEHVQWTNPGSSKG